MGGKVVSLFNGYRISVGEGEKVSKVGDGEDCTAI
jgi:hypothetical protein